MSFSVTEAFVKQYNSTVMQLSQQKGSRLQDKVRRETQKGKEQYYDRLGSVTAQKKVSRHSDTPLINTPHSRRRVSLVDYEHADLVDNADKIKMLIDPASDYAMAFAWAFGRAKDDEIIAAADGAAYGGESGSTSVSHPNTQKLGCVNAAANAGAGLNVEALRRAKQIFDENDVDESLKRCFAHTAKGLSSLLSETETTSADFNTVRALVKGELNEFMGFEFVRTQRLGAQSGALSFSYTDGSVGSGSGDADTYTKNIAWAEDGLLLATGMDMMTKIDERADKSYSTQVFAAMGIGATRLEEEKVVIVLSDEA